LGGIDQGAKNLKGITKKELLLTMKQNLEILKGILKEVNFM
jgi:N-acetylmuramoyl-L-alanine amidase